MRGRCLCGAVEFEITGKTTEIGMCHCSKCRRVSGVASNATLMVASDGLRWISGEQQITKFELPAGWSVTRCATCGSPAPLRHPGGGAYWVPAGLLDEAPGLRVAMHIFVDSKAEWNEIAGPAPQHREDFDSEKI
jgi:hypothetical protein